MKEDMIYIFKVKETRLDEKQQEFLVEKQVEYVLSEEHISIDKGRAIYYRGFTNHYVLIGLMRSLFSQEGCNEVMEMAHEIGDHFVFGKGKFMAVWTGVWEPLERIGMTAVTFRPSVVDMMINEIHMSMGKNNGKLVDRC